MKRIPERIYVLAGIDDDEVKEVLVSDNAFLIIGKDRHYVEDIYFDKEDVKKIAKKNLQKKLEELEEI